MKKALFLLPIVFALCSCGRSLPASFPSGLKKIKNKEAEKILQDIIDKNCVSNLGETGTFSFYMKSYCKNENVPDVIKDKVIDGTAEGQAEFDKDYCHIRSIGNLKSRKDRKHLVFDFHEYQYRYDDNSYMHAILGYYESSNIPSPVYFKEYAIYPGDITENIAVKYASEIAGAEYSKPTFWENVVKKLTFRERNYTDGTDGTLYQVYDQSILFDVAKMESDGHLIYENYVLKERKLHANGAGTEVNTQFTLDSNKPFVKTYVSLDDTWTLDNNMPMKETIYSDFESYLN